MCENLLYMSSFFISLSDVTFDSKHRTSLFVCRSPLSESTPVASFKEKVKKKNIIIDSDEEGDSRTEHHLPDNSDNTYNIDTSNEEEDDEDYIPDDHGIISNILNFYIMEKASIFKTVLHVYKHNAHNSNYCFIFIDLRSISYSPVQSKNRKRKDISHDYTKEDIKELKHNSSEESLTHLEDKSIAKDDTKQQNIDRKVPNEKKKTDVAEIVISSGIFYDIKDDIPDEVF